MVTRSPPVPWFQNERIGKKKRINDEKKLFFFVRTAPFWFSTLHSGGRAFVFFFWKGYSNPRVNVGTGWRTGWWRL